MIGWIPPTVPVEAVPDGSTGLPHHLTYALLASLVAIARVWPVERCRNPWLALSGVIGALFGFVSVWPAYPTVGAALTGGGLAVTLSSLSRRRWSAYPLDQRIAVALLTLAAADDWVSHALGWPTPLDVAFHRLGPSRSAVAAVVIGIVAAGLLAVARWYDRRGDRGGR